MDAARAIIPMCYEVESSWMFRKSRVYFLGFLGNSDRRIWVQSCSKTPSGLPNCSRKENESRQAETLPWMACHVILSVSVADQLMIVYLEGINTFPPLYR